MLELEIWRVDVRALANDPDLPVLFNPSVFRLPHDYELAVGLVQEGSYVLYQTRSPLFTIILLGILERSPDG